ncbi:MAG: adenosine deaminase [Candidatus Marinimicrobia bacterium]|nr:adenosine deaminase [Candidatus Neomarinimicrobiota bacterium]
MNKEVKIDKKFIENLPKVDLHCHLDGSLRIDTMIELAKENGVKLASLEPEKLKKDVAVIDENINLEEYINKFDITLSVLQTYEALKRTAYELAEDASRENILYLEVRYSPILHTDKSLRAMETVDAVLEGLKQAEKDFNIQTGLIICGIRNISPEVSYKLAEVAVAYKNRGVVGFDLAGVEENFPAKNHREAFYLILDNNINTTIHAGEDYGPESIHQALHYCGAHRIGHGVKLKKDGDLLNYVNDHRIPLEICLTSNIHTGSVQNIKEHPFKFYYDYGLRVTLNTDNRLISNTTLTDEYMLAYKHFNFDITDFKEIIINSFKSAFLPHKKKKELIIKVANQLDTYVSV